MIKFTESATSLQKKPETYEKVVYQNNIIRHDIQNAELKKYIDVY